jgi:Na+/proline symporter
MPSTLTSLLVLFVTGLGFAYYIFLAQKQKSSRVEEFFVAGRNIGSALFTQTTWGSSFAFGNSIFYAVWLGYTIGLSAFWIQALWAIGMICYALLLPRLIVFTENYTLHGFLGSLYGPWCRITASLVSVIGLLILLGFEVSFVAQYFAQVTNVQHLEWLVVLAMATFVATFCNIGGFKANTVTDRLSNFIALGAMLGLLIMMIYKNSSQLAVGFSPSALWNSATDFSSQSAIYLTGLAFFALFNIVDMTNWQSVSANSLNADFSPASQEQRKKMKWAMFKATGWFMIAPVLTGTFLGYMLRVLKQGTEDQSIFMSKMVLDLLPAGSLLAAAILAVITFAFMAASLAGTDSWLLASTQTLSWDLIDYEKFKATGFKVSKFDQLSHEKITNRARLILMLVGIGGASIIYYISKYVWDQVFALQFVIFGGGLAMLPSLLFGIFIGNPSKSRILSISAVTSIVAGYSSALALFVYSLIKKNPDMVSPLPLVALGIAMFVFLVGLLLKKILTK